MVDQHIIDEAKARGIVPGARIQCASVDYKCHGTVAETEHWFGDSEHTLWVGKDDNQKELCGYSIYNERWATVITPAPQAAAEGLVEGDACECGPAMRAAIIELAKNMGVQCSCFLNNEPTVIGLRWVSNGGLINMHIDVDKAMHTPEAFISKMRVEAAKPKPIRIGDHEVKFNTGSIKVGCTTIDNATVRAIAANLKDQ
jgi:hypothetical protein